MNYGNGSITTAWSRSLIVVNVPFYALNGLYMSVENISRFVVIFITSISSCLWSLHGMF